MVLLNVQNILDLKNGIFPSIISFKLPLSLKVVNWKPTCANCKAITLHRFMRLGRKLRAIKAWKWKNWGLQRTRKRFRLKNSITSTRLNDKVFPSLKQKNRWRWTTAWSFLQYKLVQAVVNVHFPFSQLPNLKIVNAQRKLLDKVIMLQAAMVAWGCTYSLWKYRLWKISAKLRISLTVTWLLERAQMWVKPKEVRILLSDIIGTRVERS